MLTSVRCVLAAHDDVYAPASLSDEPYTGPTTLDAPAPTWWVRYFEYL